MKILVMGMNYVSEKTAIGPLTAQLCEYLVQEGHQVRVVTSFPHYPEWRIQDGYRGKAFMRDCVNGVPVYRSYVYVPSKPSSIQRIVYDSSFSLSAWVSSLQVQEIDVIVCVSPPLELGLTAWMIGAFKGTPFLFYVQDLIPDTAVDLGMLKNQGMIRLAYRLEKFVYNKASAIGVISHGFAENLWAKGVPRSKVHYLPDWIDLDFMKPLDRNNLFRRQQDLSDSDFLVMYAGTLGSKQGLEVLLDTASILREHKDIVFFIVGEGVRKAVLMEQAQAIHLPNVRFLAFQPRTLSPSMFSAADVLVLTQQARVTDSCMPSKLLYNMASATPVVAAVDRSSEAARVMVNADAGLIAKPENPKALAEAILLLHASSSPRIQFGTNGRMYVKEHFEKGKVLRRFEEILLQMWQDRKVLCGG